MYINFIIVIAHERLAIVGLGKSEFIHHGLKNSLLTPKKTLARNPLLTTIRQSLLVLTVRFTTMLFSDTSCLAIIRSRRSPTARLSFLS